MAEVDEEARGAGEVAAEEQAMAKVKVGCGKVDSWGAATTIYYSIRPWPNSSF